MPLGVASPETLYVRLACHTPYSYVREIKGFALLPCFDKKRKEKYIEKKKQCKRLNRSCLCVCMSESVRVCVNCCVLECSYSVDCRYLFFTFFWDFNIEKSTQIHEAMQDENRQLDLGGTRHQVKMGQ